VAGAQPRLVGGQEIAAGLVEAAQEEKSLGVAVVERPGLLEAGHGGVELVVFEVAKRDLVVEGGALVVVVGGELQVRDGLVVAAEAGQDRAEVEARGRVRRI
jgi:hypothetical protein